MTGLLTPRWLTKVATMSEEAEQSDLARTPATA